MKTKHKTNIFARTQMVLVLALVASLVLVGCGGAQDTAALTNPVQTDTTADSQGSSVNGASSSDSDVDAIFIDESDDVIIGEMV
jgi:uncharacterized lipoprotein YajG